MLTAFAPGSGILLLGRGVTGFGAGLAWGVTAVLVAQAGARRLWVAPLVAGVVLFGLVLVPGIAAFLTRALSWRFPFMLAVLFAVGALLVTAATDSNRTEPGGAVSRQAMSTVRPAAAPAGTYGGSGRRSRSPAARQGSDPDITRDIQTIAANRERAFRRHIEAIATQLTPGLSVDEGVTIYLALVLPEVYRTLVIEGGWTPDCYEGWLADALITQLLP